ncbi:MAG TPA: HWE histidine kinase domain-containing protein, partial [Azospirillaceae bacterium]|nr:HWE histidine kinase domain-containing protein [Azospirillaceae bacterium]
MSSLSNFALPIGADLVRFVQDEVASGRYASAADVVETALQRMRETGTRETGTRETGTRGGECANGECTAAVGDLDACEELLGSILNASGLCAGIMELLDDDILYPVLNRKAAECHGMCGAGRAGARASEVGLTREEIDKWLVFLRDCLDRGKSVSAEYPYRAAAEVTGWFVGMFTPLPPGPTGRPRVSFICIDISERKETEELQMLLVNELNHRVKNTLATVQSIVSQTLRTNEVPETVRDTLDARLLALSAAHDVLTAQDWRTADVSEIVWSAVAPYRIDGVDRFT